MKSVCAIKTLMMRAHGIIPFLSEVNIFKIVWVYICCRTLLRRNPHLEVFIDSLVDEDRQCNTADVTVLNINRSTAETMLQSTDEGTFVVRAGNKNPDKPYVISVRQVFYSTDIFL